jgi:uncharacterized protein YcfJ
MGQEYTLKTNHNPSYLNKDMVIGAMIGSFFTPFAGTAIGAAIGSYIGKKNQEKENEHGKRVSEPSMWNRDTFIGGYIGNLVGAAVAALSFAAITGVTITAAAAGAPVAAGAAALTVGTMVAGAAIIGGTVAGGYIGSKAGEARQAREYETARQQTVVQDLEKNVSPEVAKAVEYAMANDKSKNWSKEIADERAQAAAQGQEIKR